MQRYQVRFNNHFECLRNFFYQFLRDVDIAKLEERQYRLANSKTP